ncbi:hypothetical protein DFH07DRAFT_1067559 [Mycena maculata]|uniref:Protein kinase domain-containing protein n=1 Tax=Mycena maculata TaxID=230809 RepID=A0AAD7HIR9_9AGAR|nr:hypothetical protein DFH07DRAFT_1067559 [Mycena maculata]
MAAATNNRKLAEFDALTDEEYLTKATEAHDAAHNWVYDPEPHTCEEALELLKTVPPVRLGGKSTKTKEMSKSERDIPPPKKVIWDADWMDKLVDTTDFSATVPSIKRKLEFAFLLQGRLSPGETESVERITDDFHKQYIVHPACVIAGFVTGRPMAVTYTAASNGVQSDLHVQAKGDSSIKLATIENKRGIVWEEHERAFLELLDNEKLPVTSPAVRPPDPVRICIQINAQMITHNVVHSKLFSPVGVMYIWRDPRERHLFFSRVYHDLDDDVRRTACLLVAAFSRQNDLNASLPPIVPSPSFFSGESFISSWIRQQALKFFLVVTTVCGTPTVAVGPQGRPVLFHGIDHGTFLMPPRVFTRFIGSGAIGNVWRSSDGSHVIKIFRDKDAAHHEAGILQSCLEDPELVVPTFRGLYTDGQEHFGIITPYAGTALGSIYEADESKQRQLVKILHALHRNGIHHHDIRPDNVLVNEEGKVTLIDFDRARRINGPCQNCSDLALISALEGDTSDSSGSSIYPYSV